MRDFFTSLDTFVSVSPQMTCFMATSFVLLLPLYIAMSTVFSEINLTTRFVRFNAETENSSREATKDIETHHSSCYGNSGGPRWLVVLGDDDDVSIAVCLKYFVITKVS